jgi:hypothetical protein
MNLNETRPKLYIKGIGEALDHIMRLSLGFMCIISEYIDTAPV